MKITIESDGSEPIVYDGVVQYLLVGTGNLPGMEIHRAVIGSHSQMVGLAYRAIEDMRDFRDKNRDERIANKVAADLATLSVQLASRNGRLIEAP